MTVSLWKKGGGRLQHRQEQKTMWRERQRLENCNWSISHGPRGWLAAPSAGREAWTRLSLRVSRRNQPCRHLDFGLWPPELGRNKFLCFRPYRVCGCYSSPKKLIHLPLLRWPLLQVCLRPPPHRGFSKFTEEWKARETDDIIHYTIQITPNLRYFCSQNSFQSCHNSWFLVIPRQCYISYFLPDSCSFWSSL